MQFTRKLREGVIQGDITCSVRIWLRPHVKVGGAYSMPPGKVIVDSIMQIGFEDIGRRKVEPASIQNCKDSTGGFWRWNGNHDEITMLDEKRDERVSPLF